MVRGTGNCSDSFLALGFDSILADCPTSEFLLFDAELRYFCLSSLSSTVCWSRVDVLGERTRGLYTFSEGISSTLVSLSGLREIGRTFFFVCFGFFTGRGSTAFFLERFYLGLASYSSLRPSAIYTSIV